LVVEALALKHPEVIREFGMTYASWTQSLKPSGERKKPVLALSSLPVASHSAAAFLIGVLSQGSGDTPREVTGRGLEERDNWLRWWQHSDIEQTLTTKELLDATLNEVAFTRSVLWNRVDVAIEHIQQRFADDQASAQKALKVMAGACLRQQRVDDARKLMASIHASDEFLTDWIWALTNKEISLVWDTLCRICSKDPLEVLFERGKASGLAPEQIRPVRDRWLSEAAGFVFNHKETARNALLVFEHVVTELSHEELQVWLSSHLRPDSAEEIHQHFQRVAAGYAIAPTQDKARREVVLGLIHGHLKDLASQAQD
jgi:hypothetical protein